MKRRKKQRAADCTITAHASTSSKRVAYNLGTEEERNIKYATLLLQRAGSDCRLKDLEKMATVAKRATGNAFMAHCSRLFSKYRQQCCDLLEECTPLREGDPPREVHMHIPLVGTSASEVVPGSHVRSDTPEESRIRQEDSHSDKMVLWI